MSPLFRPRSTPAPTRRPRLESLEAKIAAGSLTGLGSPFAEAAQVAPPSESLGVGYADYSLVNNSTGGGGRVSA